MYLVKNRSMKISTTVLLLSVVAGCAYAQTAKPPAEIPFEFLHNQIVVQVKVNGKGPFNMLIDTDTDPSAIDAGIAKELGLQIGANGAPASGGGTEANNVYTTRLGTV
jgi:hypothetical protein